MAWSSEVVAKIFDRDVLIVMVEFSEDQTGRDFQKEYRIENEAALEQFDDLVAAKIADLEAFDVAIDKKFPDVKTDLAAAKSAKDAAVEVAKPVV